MSLTLTEILQRSGLCVFGDDFGVSTCAEVARPGAARVCLQQHALGGHLGAEGRLDVVHKDLAVGAVHPDPLAQGVLDVYLDRDNNVSTRVHTISPECRDF